MKTPLKILIFSTIGISLLAGFIPSVQAYLSLSWAGVHHFYFWQFISYIFVERGSFSLGLLISIAFNMYLLWIFGIPLYERCFPKKFFILYFGAALIGGLSALVFPKFVLASSTNAVMAVLVVWMILNPSSQLLLFFTLPFKAYILVLGLIGLSLTFDGLAQNWVGAFTLIISCIYAYFFALFVFKNYSPFLFMHPFEKRIFKLFEKRKKKSSPGPKIYDIQSGKPIPSDDDQFMDAMLDRISRHGEDSLTPEEKKRMREISKKKK